MTEEQTEQKRGPGRPPKEEAPKMYPVKLSKNVRAPQNYEVVGYWKPEYTRRTSAGDEIVPAEFMAGEEYPTPYPGVGTASKKLWAGTIVKFERDHARFLVNNRLAERADEFAAD